MPVPSSDYVLAKLLLWQADAPREISDLEAVQELALSKADLARLLEAAPGIVSVDAKTEFACPACGARVDLSAGAKKAYCESCKRVWKKGEFPAEVYSLDRDLSLEYLLSKARTELTAATWEVHVEGEPSRLVAVRDSIQVGVGVQPRTAGLKDYLALRGSLADPARSVVALVAPHFEDMLLYYTHNSPETLLIDSLSWLQGDLALAPALTECVTGVSKSIRISEEVGRNFEELALAEDIAEHAHRLLTDLPLLSLQMTAGSSSAIGNRFQSTAITVLSLFTPFKMLPVGGKNQEDAVLRFYFPWEDKKPQYYLVGVKSFKGNPDTEPYYPVGEAREQMRRYARAYVQDEYVMQEVEVPAYILIAHDFDMHDPEIQQEVRAFETDLSLPLKLLPVRTILSLVKGFSELHLDRIPNEDLIDFIMAPGAYLDSARADVLIKNLRELAAKERKDSKIAKVRDRLRRHHA